MNDAPERVWLWVDIDGWYAEERNNGDMPEYRRADLVVSKDVLRELVEAASELRCLVRRDVIETPLFDAAIALAEKELK